MCAYVTRVTDCMYEYLYTCVHVGELRLRTKAPRAPVLRALELNFRVRGFGV